MKTIKKLSDSQNLKLNNFWTRLVGANFFALLFILGAPLFAAESDNAFAYRVCSLHKAPIADATYGGGAGCTWRSGPGERGTESTEILLSASRNAGTEAIAGKVLHYDDLFRRFIDVPGYRIKALGLTCGLNQTQIRIVFWGEPYSGNLMGYAVCGNHFLFGEIHAPPSTMPENEILLEKLMHSLVPLLDS